MTDDDLKRVANLVAASVQRGRLLRAGAAGPLSHRQQLLADELDADLRTAQELIGGVVVPPKIELTKFDLSVLIRECYARFVFKARSHRVKFQLHEDGLQSVLVRADRNVAADAICAAIDEVINAAGPKDPVFVELAPPYEVGGVKHAAARVAGYNPVKRRVSLSAETEPAATGVHVATHTSLISHSILVGMPLGGCAKCGACGADAAMHCRDTGCPGANSEAGSP